VRGGSSLVFIENARVFPYSPRARR